VEAAAMQKILVISDSLESSADVRTIIERDLPYPVYASFDQEGTQAQLESKVFNLAVFDQNIMDDKALEYISWLKHSSYSFPIVVITNKIKPDLNHKLSLLHDVHVLVRPTGDKNIVGLIRKLLVARRVPKQLYRRFNTNQIAELEALTTGDSLFTSMYNLSKGGAYCEFDECQTLTIGDMIRMKVFLNDTNSEYTFNAKVVWTTPKGRFSGRFGCGFKFVSAKDTYRSLLSKT